MCLYLHTYIEKITEARQLLKTGLSDGITTRMMTYRTHTTSSKTTTVYS